MSVCISRHGEFSRFGMTLEFAWLKEDPDAFRAIESRLFLTNQERAA